MAAPAQAKCGGDDARQWRPLYPRCYALVKAPYFRNGGGAAGCRRACAVGSHRLLSPGEGKARPGGRHSLKRRFVCAECGRDFLHSHHLAAHTRTHVPRHPCPLCQQRFLRLPELEEHLRGSHPEARLSSCPGCAESFTGDEELARHCRETGHGEAPSGDEVLRCETCGKAFKLRRFLETHRRRHGDGLRPHRCRECGKEFRQYTSLAKHRLLHRTHTAERPHLCSVCGRRFNQRSTLVRHQLTHTGERPFACPDCGKAFRQSAAVLVHRRTHSQDRPYRCAQCGKGFKSKSNLIGHGRT
uniref:C2H2-type domain-containing protein n=1 Tax=Callorhinchus milii TaxID=7868 RepID=A0A4W3HPN8_CALMI